MYFDSRQLVEGLLVSLFLAFRDATALCQKLGKQAGSCSELSAQPQVPGACSSDAPLIDDAWPICGSA